MGFNLGFKGLMNIQGKISCYHSAMIFVVWVI